MLQCNLRLITQNVLARNNVWNYFVTIWKGLGKTKVHLRVTVTSKKKLSNIINLKRVGYDISRTDKPVSASKYSQLLEDTFHIKLEHGFV